MTTQTIVDSKPQTTAPQVWDKPTGIANIGDYFHLPYTPVMQVVEKGMLADGRVWLLVKPMSGSYSEEWVVEPESPALTQEPDIESETECQSQEQQPVGFAGDSVSVGLQPPGEAIAEFSQGRCHGQQDAAARLQPMYAAPSDQYAAGYSKLSEFLTEPAGLQNRACDFHHTRLLNELALVM